ncbi:MAG: methyltransferase domain-containing protein [Terriglobales bacterium]|jgi:SAM-dependent methyltransferase
MELPKTIRKAVGRILGPQMIRSVRRYRQGTVGGLDVYRSYLTDKRGLEIGGPSGILGDEGPLPVYSVLASLDNCLYSSRTIWAGEVKDGSTFKYHPLKSAGEQFICEATDLEPVANSSYDCVLASHCLEHVANPFRALTEWRRVLKENGLLLLLLPHRDGTFDWRRPATSLDHMIQDHADGVSEDDLTHLPEVLELHDLRKDIAAGTREEFRQRCLENHSNRAMHQHVFDTLTAIRTVDHAKFEVIRVDNLKPYHIIILARRHEGEPDNQKFLRKGAEHWGRSPFPSDRRHR